MDVWDFCWLLRSYGQTHGPRNAMIFGSGNSGKLFCQGKVKLESCKMNKYF